MNIDFRFDQVVSLYDLLITLIRIKVEVADYSVPLYLFFILAVILLVTYRSFIPKKRRRWRIAYSRRWLKGFRDNKPFYSKQQRFNYVRSLDCYLWEEVLMSAFELRGYKVERTGYSRDGGSDGFVTINKIRVIVQAKLYSGRVSKGHVIALNELAMKGKMGSKGLFIHTGKSSRPILEYCRNSTSIELISGVDAILDFLDGAEIQLFGETIRSIQ